jgi:hypothetical protein
MGRSENIKRQGAAVSKPPNLNNGGLEAAAPWQIYLIYGQNAATSPARHESQNAGAQCRMMT